jgi:F-type H+-transporting ATPase subunit gamma
MSNLRTIKRRIKSIKNINEITKAMEMISAVRFKRVEARLKKSLPYFEHLAELIARIASPSLCEGNPFFEKRTVRKELLIFATGDRGLCGSFNNNLLKQALGYLHENPNQHIEVLPVGKVGLAYAKRRGWHIHRSVVDLGYQFTPSSLRESVEKLVRSYLSKEFDRIQILTMRMGTGGIAKPRFDTFLGLEGLLEKKSQSKELDYIFEPSQKVILDTLIELYIRQNLFITLLSSVTAEFRARMVAMKLATDNGKEIIEDLTLLRNKIRQAMITKEISEIIGGVNALQ